MKSSAYLAVIVLSSSAWLGCKLPVDRTEKTHCKEHKLAAKTFVSAIVSMLTRTF